MPRFSRPDILFAVTVPEAFAAGAGRTLVARYRAIVWSGAAAALAISLLLPTPQPGSGRGALLMMAVVAGNMIVAPVRVAVGAPEGARARRPAFRRARRLTRPARHVAAGWGAVRRRTVCHSAGHGAARYTYRDDVPDGPGTIKPFGCSRWAASTSR